MNSCNKSILINNVYSVSSQKLVRLLGGQCHKKIQKITIFIFIYNKIAALQVPLILTIA